MTTLERPIVADVDIDDGRRWFHSGGPIAGGTILLRYQVDPKRGIVDPGTFEFRPGPDTPADLAPPRPAARAGSEEDCPSCGGASHRLERWGMIWMSSETAYPERWRLCLGPWTVLRASWAFDAAWWAWRHGGRACWALASQTGLRALRASRAVLGRLRPALRLALRLQPFRVRVDEGEGCGCHLRAKQAAIILSRGWRVWKEQP